MSVASIMNEPWVATVDVRQMLCAQALALIAKAAAQLQPGQRLEIAYDADDVKRDALVWAQDRGYAAQAVDGTTLVVTRHDASPRGPSR